MTSYDRIGLTTPHHTPHRWFNGFARMMAGRVDGSIGTGGWVRWAGGPAHHTSALALLSGVALAHLGSHSGGGMIVQDGGAMYLDSSTATVSDTDFTSCSTDNVRDGPTPHP